MNINTSYFQRLNILKPKINQLTSNIVNLFRGKSDVIQIGIGGYSSSGKTVLIDAIFSIFDTMVIPGYMPDNFTGMLLDASEEIPAYSGHNTLRSDVSINFHTDHKTRDEGVWYENTYRAKLNFCSKKKILLVRNLPGEMFNVYYEASGNERKSLKTRFIDFIGEHKEYKKLYKKLFKFEYAKKDAEQKKTIENKLIEIRDAFFKNVGLANYINKDKIPTIEKNFFAFLFYLTSDYNVYCIRSKGMEEDEIKTANENIFSSNSGEKDGQKFMICFTQFDRIFRSRELPQIDLLSENEKIGKKKYMASLNELLGIKKEKNALLQETEITKYWLAMNSLYIDLEKKEQSIVNTSDWNALKAITGNFRCSWFTTSVAYNLRERKFFDFENQDGNLSSDIWTLQNNNLRTPVGVLELILYILTKSGFKKSKWKLALPDEIEFDKVIKKIKGKS